jgi:ABC-type lipoprotein release transport system permease subunit
LLMIPPSLMFFIALPLLLGWNISFILSLLISVSLTGIVYWVYLYILNFFGIHLV